MLKIFNYTKVDGSKSARVVYPLNLSGDDKLLCVDLTEFNAEERQEYDDILDEIHKNYIKAIKEVGLGSTFRTFFIERMD